MVLATLPILGERSWFFPEGSRFGDRHLWWDESRKRAHPHEGIDFFSLLGPAAVQTVATGVIVALAPDFLGHSIWIRHPLAGGAAGCHLHSVYAHLRGQLALAIGQELESGELLGEVNFSPNIRSAPAHLHFSLAWLADTLHPGQLNWETIHRQAPGCFFDPLPWLKALGLKISDIGHGQKQQQFVARGLASGDEARRTGVYFSEEEVLRGLDEILATSEGK